jgi:methylenetetrahydrofolate reductase (NADPH)
VEGFAEWMGAVREAGLHERTHIIAGVGPPSDPAQEGTKACADIAARVKAIEGVRGIHIFSGGSDDVVASVIQQAGLSRS